MATTIEASWLQFEVPDRAPGVPEDPTDPCHGKHPTACGCGCGGCECGCGGCECGCECGCGGAGGPPKGLQPPRVSGRPVRYATGEPLVEADDLHAGGFGLAWGHTRSFASRLTEPTDAGNGVNWQVQQWPYLVRRDDGTVVLMGRANAAVWFDPVAGGFQARFDVRQTLTTDAAAGVYRVSDPDGSSSTFDLATGAFRWRTDPAGNRVEVVGTTANGFNFTEVRRALPARAARRWRRSSTSTTTRRCPARG
ncbi:MAG: hypothetical protein U0736_20695 [Gemmataceae bacterium]